MMENNKAPGPHGFPAEVYQLFWEITNGGMMEHFNEFHIRNLPLHNLNFGIITLISKKADAIKIQQYRSIFLFNVTFKTFTKVLRNMFQL